VLDRGRRAELALEAPAELVVVRELGRDHLQRDLALERNVGGAVDDAHPAAPGDAADHVVGEDRAGRHLGHQGRAYRGRAAPTHLECARCRICARCC
jgi:hypothetical protein